MNLLGSLTGGKSDEASSRLKEAQAAFAGIPLPTLQQLSLPELQQYVEAGILTPAEAKIVTQSSNAYNDIKPDTQNIESEQDALSKIKAVADAKGMTPEMRAQLTQALDQVATATHGNQAAISDQFAQKGIPQSLMAEAALRESAGNDARNANLSATQAAGQAEQNAIAAMQNEGDLASRIRGENYSQESNKAAAQNAIQQWNAQATNQGSEANANRAQTANEYNTENKQNVSNANVGNTNMRTQYNANIPQQIFNNAITKASGQAGISKEQSDLANSQGNRVGQITGGVISQLSGAITGGKGQIPNPYTSSASGPSQFSKGGEVPGNAAIPGNSPKNDTVPARLSPGEIVLPRTVTTSSHAPELAKSFVHHLLKKPVKVHPEDVANVLHALTIHRGS